MIGTAVTITQMRISKTPLGLIQARLVFFAVAVGAAILGSAGLPTATGYTPVNQNSNVGFRVVVDFK